MMEMTLIQGIFLFIICIVGIIIGFKMLYDMPGEIIKNMEVECSKVLEKKDKELGEKQNLYKGLRRWLFK